MSCLGFNLKEASVKLKTIQSDINDYGVIKYHQDKVWQIYRHHFSNNSFYNNHLKNHTYSNWKDIPEISKKDYQKPLKELICRGNTLSKLFVSNTSGSTGTPFFFAKDKMCHAIAWELIYDKYKEFSVNRDDLQARFYGIPLKGLASIKEKIKDWVMVRERFPVFDLSEIKLNEYLEKFRKHKFVYVYGYTNSIVHFSHYLVGKKIILKDICPSLKVVIVTSEMCTETDRLIIEKGTGVNVVIEYGASEAGIIAIENKEQKLKAADELLYIENNIKFYYIKKIFQ
jgi:phenylacetate-CoA ligase